VFEKKEELEVIIIKQTDKKTIKSNLEPFVTGQEKFEAWFPWSVSSEKILHVVSFVGPKLYIEV